MADELRVNGTGNLILTEEQRRRWGIEEGATFTVRETLEGLVLQRDDPVLGRVIVEPTSLCNLDCRTCVRHSWTEPAGMMDIAVYERLIAGLRRFPAVGKVSFWGFGEPLMHPKIAEMVALAKRLGAKTEIVTNALLLDRRLAIDLVDAGLDSVVISIDGVSAESYSDIRSGAELRLVRQNIETLRTVRYESPRRNPEIGLEFVAMRSNVEQLPRLRSLAYEVGASFVIVTNVLPYTKEMSDEILYNMSVGRTYVSAHNKWAPEFVMPTIDLRHAALQPVSALVESLEGAITRAGRLTETGGFCRFVGEGTIAVSWDGEVCPCPALMHSYTCFILGREKRIKRYSWGNAGAESLAEIWARAEAKRFRSLVRRFDFSPCSACGGCHLAESNEEDCYGNTFPVCGDCLWAQGVIQCP